MREPSPRSSRLAIAGSLAAAIAVGTGGFFLGRGSTSQPAPTAGTILAPPTPVPSPPSIDTAAKILGRADLLALADAAADAFASGQPVPPELAAAKGRQFDLVLPFGCAGPTDRAATTIGWQYDASTSTLRVTATPVSWSGADWHVRQGDEAATATGFWINRPWSSGERCPKRTGEAAPSGTTPVTLPGQTLAIAAFGAEGVLGGAGRAFKIVRRMPEFDGSQGLKLRITGRLDRAETATPVHCVQPAGLEQHPICTIAATIEEVKIEVPTTEAVLATWTIDRAN